jgi:uncharacterized protein (DUF1800 family)
MTDSVQVRGMALRSADRAATQPHQTRNVTALPPLPIIALNRIAYGITEADLAHFNSLGNGDEERLAAYVDLQLDPASISDSDYESRLANSNFVTHNLTTVQLWLDYRRDFDNVTSSALPLDELRRLALLRAVYSKRQLQAVMIDFWHNHFNVHGPQFIIRSMIMAYDRDVLAAHAFGNFRTLIEAVGTNVAMLYYLDNYTNSSGGPNENYARELFELHGLGEENYLGAGIRQHEVAGYPVNPVGYVDDDVYEATRCFTGWTVSDSTNNPTIGDTGEFYYRDDWHDRFQKQVLGEYIPANQAPLADGKKVYDLIAAHPGTARYICRKLCRRFIDDDPDATLVQAAADIFLAQKDAPDQIAQVLRFILNSAEFRTTFGTKVKRPFEGLAALLRATNAEINLDIGYSDGNTIIYRLADTGHELFNWPAPNGYPDVAGYWLNTTSIYKRWRLFNWLMSDRDENDNFHMDIVGQTPTESTTAEGIVDYWIGRIFGYALPEAERLELIDFMAAGYNPTYNLPIFTNEETAERLRSLVGLMFMSPSFLTR